MTVPLVPKLDDWNFEIVNVSDGTATNVNVWIRDVSGWAGRGASGHRLESCDMELVSEVGGAQSPAAAALAWAGVQLLRVTPYADATHEMWGLILKDKEAYTERGRWDTIKVTVAPVGYLLHGRVVYYKANAGANTVAVSAAASPADDFLKYLVAQCTSGVDPDGDSRAWDAALGTLAIEANESLAPAITQTELNGYLDEVIDGIAKANSVDWELKPSVSAGAVTFTFATAYPRGGSDKTTGASRVIINDFGAMVPTGERYFDLEGMATVALARGYKAAYKNTAAYTAYGRWEVLTQSEAEEDALKADVSRLGPKSGGTWGFNASATAGQCRWMAEYEVGDLVLRNNTRLGISAASEEINGIKWSFPKRVLELEIRWGNKEPTQSSKNSGGKHRPKPDDINYPAWGSPVGVATDNDAGTSNDMLRADAKHLLRITADDAGYMPLTAGVGYITGAGGVATKIVDGKLVVDGSGGVTPAPHALLSATHNDTTAASVVRGDLIVGQGEFPDTLWTRLAIGAAYTFPMSDGTDLAYHAAVIAVAGDVGDGATPDAVGAVTFGGSAGYSFNAHDNQVDFTGPWQRTTGAVNWIGPATSADSVVINAAVAPGAAATKLYVNGDIEVESTLKAYSGRLYLSGQDGTIDCYTDGTATTLNVDDGDGTAQIGLLATGTSYFNGGNLIVQNSHTFALYADGLGASLKCSIDGANGNIWLEPAATLHIGGYTYTWPTSGAATGESLTATVAGANITLAWTAPAPAAHDIVSAHTYTGGAALDVFGLSAADTIARLTPASAPGANAKILCTDASGYLRLERLEIYSAAKYLSRTDTALVYEADGYHFFTIGGTSIVRISGSAIYPYADSATTCGTDSLRWLNGYFDDLVVTKGGAITFGGDTNIYRSAANTLKTDDALTVTGTITGSSTSTAAIFQGNVTMASEKTVDGVDISAWKALYDAHTHNYIKPVQYHATGYDGDVVTGVGVQTGSYSYYECDYNSDGSVRYYVYTATDASGTSAAWRRIYLPSKPHYHNVSYDTVASAAP